MVFHPCARSAALIWRSNPTRWRPRSPCWQRPHCSSASASSDLTRGPVDTSKDPPSGSAEKPPHTPVMLKEVLQYLDIQRGEVCFTYLVRTNDNASLSIPVYACLLTTNHVKPEACGYERSELSSSVIGRAAVPSKWRLIRKKMTENWKCQRYLLLGKDLDEQDHQQVHMGCFAYADVFSSRTVNVWVERNLVENLELKKKTFTFPETVNQSTMVAVAMWKAHQLWLGLELPYAMCQNIRDTLQCPPTPFLIISPFPLQRSIQTSERMDRWVTLLIPFRKVPPGKLKGSINLQKCVFNLNLWNRCVSVCFSSVPCICLTFSEWCL